MNINNIKRNDFTKRILYCKKNRIYNNIVNSLSVIDSIMDYNEFKDRIRPVAESKSAIINYRYSPGSYHYGYYTSFLNYAGIDKELCKVPVFGNMEHGMANINSDLDQISPLIMSYCSHTDHRKKELRKLSSELMYFSIGPYIHYATKYYDENTEKELKERLGKTLLVFPFHTCEGEEFGKGEEKLLYDIVYQKYASRFDTIMVCAYWYDVNNRIFDLYKKNGAMIVSAGFRGDPQFIRRLKSIISLSDTVVMDEVGTQLGFCNYMGKDVFLEKRDSRFESDRLYQMNLERFIRSYFSEDMSFSEEQRRDQAELYNEFWGRDKIRSREESNAIVKCLLEILKRSNYNRRKLREKRIATRYLLELELQKDDESRLMKKILEESLN